MSDTDPEPTSESDGGGEGLLGLHLTDTSQLADLFDDEFEPPARRLTPTHIAKLMTRWRAAAKRLASTPHTDPWECFAIAEQVPSQLAKRFRYSAIRKEWTEDVVEVKLHPEAFARGAMRECFRLKKLPSSGTRDWKNAQNYVAKKYMNEVDRRVLFEDVKLQMDAKLWAEEFNRHRPPKKIDIMQMCIIELLPESGQLYHLEHFIEGDYIKYNSNSGFVSNDHRLTPQAFSHFTFERSGHQLIVVDVQGVGDLYTDPQIHTALGSDYGDGNLGTRGMALFFRSHECNDICHSLCLSPFDLAESEASENRTRDLLETASTVFFDETPVCLAVPEESDATEYLRRRTLSRMSTDSNHEDHGDDCVCLQCVTEIVAPQRGRRSRNSSFTSSYGTRAEVFWKRRQPMPACIDGAIELCDAQGEESRSYQTTVLGQVHVDLARYYELGRFGEEMDKNSACFHLAVAVKCANLESIMTTAHIAYGLPHDLLKAVQFEDLQLDKELSGSREHLGFYLMEQAAEQGDRTAMMFIAKAYETGFNMGNSSGPDYKKAVSIYQKLLGFQDENGNEVEEQPSGRYQILAKIAELYKEGGYGLEQNFESAYIYYTDAAEAALEAGDGKLANKYFEFAEQCAI